MPRGKDRKSCGLTIGTREKTRVGREIAIRGVRAV